MNSNKIKRGLGRGLSSLIGETKVETNINKISISELVPNKYQPRKLFDQEEHEIGYITSGAFSPTIKSSIAIGYIEKNLKVGEKIFTSIRNSTEELEIVNLPFIIHNYKKG